LQKLKKMTVGEPVRHRCPLAVGTVVLSNQIDPCHLTSWSLGNEFADVKAMATRVAINTAKPWLADAEEPKAISSLPEVPSKTVSGGTADYVANVGNNLRPVEMECSVRISAANIMTHRNRWYWPSQGLKRGG